MDWAIEHGVLLRSMGSIYVGDAVDNSVELPKCEAGHGV